MLMGPVDPKTPCAFKLKIKNVPRAERTTIGGVGNKVKGLLLLIKVFSYSKKQTKTNNKPSNNKTQAGWGWSTCLALLRTSVTKTATYQVLGHLFLDDIM